MTDTIVMTLGPAISILAKCLERSSESYQQLLNHTEAYSLCAEVGRSTRHLADCYSRVLCAALGYPMDYDADEDANDEELISESDLEFE